MMFKQGDTVTFSERPSDAFKELIIEVHGNPPYRVTSTTKIAGGHFIYFKKLKAGYEGWNVVNFKHTTILDEELFTL